MTTTIDDEEIAKRPESEGEHSDDTTLDQQGTTSATETSDAEEADESEEEEADHEDASESASARDSIDESAPPSDGLAPIEAPGEVVLNGIFAGLAAMIPVAGTTIVYIGKQKDESILVTIVPAPSEKEKATDVVPIQVRGTSAEIDRGLLEALQTYVPARRTAIASAVEVAAAQLKKTNAARTTTTTPARHTPSTLTYKRRGSLTIKVKPKDATLIVKNEAGKKQAVLIGKRATIEHGKYTISLKLKGYDEITDTVTVSDTPLVKEYAFEKKGTLTVKLSPPNAHVTIAIGEAEPTALTTGEKHRLPHGIYKLVASADGHEEKTQNVALADEPRTIEIALAPTAPRLF